MDRDAMPMVEWLPLNAPSGRMKDQMKVQVCCGFFFESFTGIGREIIHCPVGHQGFRRTVHVLRLEEARADVVDWFD